MAGTPASKYIQPIPHNIGCINNLSLNYIKSPNSIGLGPVKPNLSLVENLAFIGSIIDVLVGIINISGGFYRNFDKINQNYHTGVKITKLGREIIEISIISPFQSHKLLILQGINRNFDLFPQKCILKQVFTPIWGTVGEISPISTKFTYFEKAISIHNSAGICNTSG